MGPFVGSERRPRAGREEKVTRGLAVGNFGCHHRGRIKQAGNMEPSVKHLDGGFLKVPAAVSTSCWAGPAAWRRWRTAGCPAASTQPRARWRLWRPDVAGPPPLWRPEDQSGEASRRFTKMAFNQEIHKVGFQTTQCFSPALTYFLFLSFSLLLKLALHHKFLLK